VAAVIEQMQTPLKAAMRKANASASAYRRSKNVVIESVIISKLDLGNRHKGQSLGNKPDRHDTFIGTNR
jgi:hypothetical protein